MNNQSTHQVIFHTFLEKLRDLGHDNQQKHKDVSIQFFLLGRAAVKQTMFTSEYRTNGSSNIAKYNFVQCTY